MHGIRVHMYTRTPAHTREHIQNFALETHPMKLAKRLVLTTTAIAAVTAGTLLSATTGRAAPAHTPSRGNCRLRTPSPHTLTGEYPCTPLGCALRVANTEPMTQRVELATVMDRLAVDGLITEYAVAVDDGDWEAYRRLFTADGWLAQSMRLFSMRQHLIVNRRVSFGSLEQDAADLANCQADYVNPMRFAETDGGSTEPDFVCGGRYGFTLLRTPDGWRLRGVTVQEKWRRTTLRTAATT
jgi:hypothetical protein